MVGVSKLTPAQRHQNAVMLFQHYHDLCNRNDSSSIFVSLPHIPNIEELSQSTILSLDSESCVINQSDVKIKQPTSLEVSDTKTVMDYNKDPDLPPPHDILNVFSAAYFSSCSSSVSNKYKRVWLNAKLIRSYIFSD